jgi:hypothetical protein
MITSHFPIKGYSQLVQLQKLMKTMPSARFVGNPISAKEALDPSKLTGTIFVTIIYDVEDSSKLNEWQEELLVAEKTHLAVEEKMKQNRKKSEQKKSKMKVFEIIIEFAKKVLQSISKVGNLR